MSGDSDSIRKDGKCLQTFIDRLGIPISFKSRTVLKAMSFIVKTNGVERLSLTMVLRRVEWLLYSPTLKFDFETFRTFLCKSGSVVIIEVTV